MRKVEDKQYCEERRIERSEWQNGKQEKLSVQGPCWWLNPRDDCAEYRAGRFGWLRKGTLSVMDRIRQAFG
jgi:hypothetical protein